MSSLGANFSKDEMHDNTNINANLSPNHLNTASSINSSYHSGVSWAAVLAGTLAAAALSLILVILGLGFGMSSVSVWSGQGVSAGTLGFTAIAWLAFTQIIAYGMGGFLAGRLRVKWVALHDDEVYFRDTAHGFLTWALASLLCATLLASTIGKIVGGAANAGANLVGGISTATMGAAASNTDLDMNNSDSTRKLSVNNPLQYMVSSLFRKDIGGVNTASDNFTNNNTTTNINTPTSGNNTSESSSQKFTDAGSTNQVAEVVSIFVNNLNTPALPPNEIKYAGQLISQQTGLSQTEAEGRVAMAFKTLQEKKAKVTQATKEIAEKARKTVANTALWFFVLLLIGAFSASLAATWGGKCRDN